jgi:tight adherence protein C
MGLMFVGTTLMVGAVIYFLTTRKTVLEERLESLTPVEEEAYYAFQQEPTAWQRFLGLLGKQVPLRPSEHGKYTRRLFAAGFRREALPIFMGAKVFFMVVLPVIYVVSYGLPFERERTVMITMAAALAIVGFLLPSYWLSLMVRKRKMQIFYDLPDVLDLMTVCVEAGLSMDASIIRISNDRQFSRSPLSKELKIATQETRAGKPRSDALKDMADRVMLDDLRSFISMLIQTEKLGTSLAQSLRIHSDSLRTIRRQKAEEAAAKTAIKLLFPLVFLIMPSIFVVMLLPALLRLSKFFGNM